ncbi:MAG: CoA-transferase, partial [Alphaproteobacteria bacterium]
STGLDDTERAPAIGGAMDLARGAKRVHVLAMHNAKDGSPRIVESCQYPLTAPGCVKRVYTDIAVVDIEPEGVVLREMLGGMSFEEIQTRTGATLTLAPDCARLRRAT